MLPEQVEEVQIPLDEGKEDKLTLDDAEEAQIPIKFSWAFGCSYGEEVSEDLTQYTYKGEINELETVLNFSMLPEVTEEVRKGLEKEIQTALNFTCLNDYRGVAFHISEYICYVEEIRLHFRCNIINPSCYEYDNATIEFVEAIGAVNDRLLLHQLIDFMVPRIRYGLSWVDDKGFERPQQEEKLLDVIVENLERFLYGSSGTSIIVTVKTEEGWSWEPKYDGREPKIGIVYDLMDSRGKYYQGIVTEKFVGEEQGFTFHYIGWDRKWDERCGLELSNDRIFTRENHTDKPHQSGNAPAPGLGGAEYQAIVDEVVANEEVQDVLGAMLGEEAIEGMGALFGF